MAHSQTALERIIARPRWTADDARVVLDALDASGMSTPAFAAQHGIQAQRIYLWRRTLAASPASATTTAPRSPVTFVEFAAPAGHARTSTAKRYELVLAGGETLRIEGAVDMNEVRALLALLRAGRAC